MLNQMIVCRVIVFMGGILLTAMTAAAADVIVNSDGVPGRTVVAKTTVKDVELQVTMERRYSAGHAMECVLLVTNRSQKSLVYWERELLRGFNIRVEDPDGKLVPQTRWGDFQIRKPDEIVFKNTRMTLPAGESILMKINIARYYDMTMPRKYKVAFEWSSAAGEAKAEFQLKVEGLEFEVREP